jgi:hypothetical protein
MTPEEQTGQIAVLLGHPVALILAEHTLPQVAVSVAGLPPRLRAAWLGRDDQRVIARVGCPPLVASRMRPVVACVITVDQPDLTDHLLLARTVPEVRAVRLLLTADGDGSEVDVPIGPDGVAAARLEPGVIVLAVDALDERGEPLGRLVRAGIAELTLEGGAVGGRLGVTHGMAAGFGSGHWTADLDAATFAAGYAVCLPGWLPEGFVQGPPHLEPDVAYPAAPPAVVIAWKGTDHQRVLVRQAPAPLMSPDSGGAGAREVDINGVPGVLRGRHLATVVFERDEYAFGVQVQHMADCEAVALQVARSIPI